MLFHQLFTLTWEAGFMELNNGIGAASPLHCNRFDPPVLFNFLLHGERECDTLATVVISDCITATRAGGSTCWCYITLHGPRWYLPHFAGQHLDAAGRSFSQTWGARPGSSVSSEVDRRDCRTFLLHLHHHGCHQNEEVHRHSWN